MSNAASVDEKFNWEEAARFVKLDEIRNDFIKFVEYVLVDDDGEYWFTGEHQKEWAALLLDKSIRNLIIMAPRKHGKTQWMVATILYLLGIDHNMCIKYVSESDTLAGNVVSQVKRNIESNKRLHEVFPTLKPNRAETWTGHTIIVQRTGRADLGKKDASLEASGVTSSSTGGRADLIIFDDIIGARATITEPGRHIKVRTLFYSDWMNIGGVRHIVIGTPWTPTDLHVELLTKPGWINWKQAAINDDGKPLWPEQWSLEALEEKRIDVGDVVFDQQFMLKGLRQKQTWWTPQMIDACKRHSLMLGQTQNPVLKRYLGLDPAASLRIGGSFSCATAAGVDEDGHKTIIDVRRERIRPVDVAKLVIEMDKRHHFDMIIVENNSTQEAFVDLIKILAENDPMVTDLDKRIRGYFTGSQKWNPEIGLPRLITEMVNDEWSIPFAGKHDDPLHTCPICSLIKEMLGFPDDAETDDMIMSLWLTDIAISGLSLIGNIPVVASRKSRQMGW